MIDETRRGVLRLFGISAAAAVPTTAAIATVAEVAPPAMQNPVSLPLQPPAGMTYNWKRVFIDRATPNFAHIFEMIAYGWKPVPYDRHVDLLGPGDGHYWIEFGGLVLMEKPTNLCGKLRPVPTPFAEQEAAEQQWPHREVKGWGDGV